MEITSSTFVYHLWCLWMHGYEKWIDNCWRHWW